MDNQQSSNAGWIVLVGIISILALVFAWSAYNRAGTDLTTQVEQETEDVAIEAEQAAAQFGNSVENTFDDAVVATENAVAWTEARADLIAMRAELEAEENYAEAVAEVQEVRFDLQNTYQNAEASVQAQWQEVDAELAAAEQALRENSADTLEVVGGAILLLEADVRTDEQ